MQSLQLFVIGRCTSAGDIELRGTGKSLLDLAKMLTDEHGSSEGSLLIPEGSSADPYDDFLMAIHVLETEERVRIDLEGNELVISGSAEKLKILADNIELLVSNSDAAESEGYSHHLHLDYYPNHFFLSDLSKSMVVVVEKNIHCQAEANEQQH